MTTSDEELGDEEEGLAVASATEEDLEEGGEEEKKRLGIEVVIDQPSACQRHITVTVPREEVDRYFDEQFAEVGKTAPVPGFRPGRAPRKLVEARFKKDVAGKVKSTLLVDSIAQISEDHELAAISEPDLDPEAIELPDEGPFTFEFNVEVRPDFEMPNWKGLKIDRPVRDFTEADVDRQLSEILTQYGRLVPKDGPAEPGDYITTNLSFKVGDETISSSNEEVIRLRKVLSFRDGRIEAFDKLMKGVKAGETRQGPAKISLDAPNESLRGKEVEAVFEVLDIKRLELPELTPEFLAKLGDFKNEAELREAIQAMLARRLKLQQQDRARAQVTAALTVSAKWDLPPDLLKRQSKRELERRVLELRRSGYPEQEIRTHENDLRQNSLAVTARALKEHFILERIAEDEKIEDTPKDYTDEIALIAEQSGETPRRVRARLEKRGMMDVLRNQIIERKVIELILEHGEFKDVPYQVESSDAEAISQSAGGGEEPDEPEIPEAKPGGGTDTLPTAEHEHRH